MSHYPDSDLTAARIARGDIQISQLLIQGFGNVMHDIRQNGRREMTTFAIFLGFWLL